MEVFESTKKYLSEHANELKSMGTTVVQVDCDSDSNEILMGKIMEAIGPTNEQDVAAQKLQANVRGFVVRKSLARRSRLVVLCQARWRGVRVRHKLKYRKRIRKEASRTFFLRALGEGF